MTRRSLAAGVRTALLQRYRQSSLLRLPGVRCRQRELQELQQKFDARSASLEHQEASVAMHASDWRDYQVTIADVSELRDSTVTVISPGRGALPAQVFGVDRAIIASSKVLRGALECSGPVPLDAPADAIVTWRSGTAACASQALAGFEVRRGCCCGGMSLPGRVSRTAPDATSWRVVVPSQSAALLCVYVVRHNSASISANCGMPVRQR